MKSVAAPSLIGIVLTLVVAIWTLREISLYLLFDPLKIQTFAVLLPAVIAVVEYIFLLGQLEKAKPEERLLALRNWRWFILPIASILILSATFLGWPMHLRFLISKPAFERTLVQLKSGEDIGEPPYAIGAFQIDWIIFGDNDEVYFNTGRAATDAIGVSYNPTNPPQTPNYIKLSHNWYGGLNDY